MEKQNEDVPILVAQTGPLNGERWLLRRALTIGRDLKCDIVISDRQVSRHHATLTPTAEGIFIEDMGSKNGTHCNGTPLSSATFLQDGDTIQIAFAQQFVFISSDATIPLEEGELEIALMQAGLLNLEKRSRRVWIGDDEVLPPLSVSQFALLEILYDNQGKVVTRRDLIHHIWGEDPEVIISEQALDALVRRLRDRLTKVNSEHQFIATVRGHGLRLDNPLRKISFDTHSKRS